MVQIINHLPILFLDHDIFDDAVNVLMPVQDAELAERPGVRDVISHRA